MLIITEKARERAHREREKRDKMARKKSENEAKRGKRTNRLAGKKAGQNTNARRAAAPARPTRAHTHSLGGRGGTPPRAHTHSRSLYFTARPLLCSTTFFPLSPLFLLLFLLSLGGRLCAFLLLRWVCLPQHKCTKLACFTLISVFQQDGCCLSVCLPIRTTVSFYINCIQNVHTGKKMEILALSSRTGRSRLGTNFLEGIC
jgi:hypothetical protein